MRIEEPALLQRHVLELHQTTGATYTRGAVAVYFDEEAAHVVVVFGARLQELLPVGGVGPALQVGHHFLVFLPSTDEPVRLQVDVVFVQVWTLAPLQSGDLRENAFGSVESVQQVAYGLGHVIVWTPWHDVVTCHLHLGNASGSIAPQQQAARHERLAHRELHEAVHSRNSVYDAGVAGSVVLHDDGSF